MKIAGLDIGTTGCKLTVFDEQGSQLGKAYRDYPVRRHVSGHEIDISTMMESVYGVIGEMAAQYPDIAGIGVTSFGETFVMTDEAGEPLHNAMLYTDPRGSEECAELAAKLGADHIAEVTGLAPHEMYSISKLMWIKNTLLRSMPPQSASISLKTLSYGILRTKRRSTTPWRPVPWPLTFVHLHGVKRCLKLRGSTSP